MSLPSNKGKAAKEQDVAADEVAAEADVVDEEADEAVAEAEAEGTSSASAVVIKVMSRTNITPLLNTLNSTLSKRPNYEAFGPLARAVPRTPRIAIRGKPPRCLPNYSAISSTRTYHSPMLN
jgi:hypothetical protein